MGDGRARAFKADFIHRVAEQQPVFGLGDHLGIGADQLNAIFFQDAELRQRHARIQTGLPTHRR